MTAGAVALALAACACGGADTTASVAGGAAGSPARGGDLVVSARTEPRTFNRLTSREATTDLVASLMQAKLVRINRVTDEVEPWLAERWTRAASGLSYTLTLRPNVTFSDGRPLTADDVVFSLEAAYAVPLAADALQPGGKKLTLTAADPLTLVLTFPVPYAPGLRILDNLWVLPRHKLEAALRNGTIAAAWGLSTPPSDIAGLGPFVLSAYSPGQRLVFARNPRYWRKDDKGTQLPYLDRLTIDVVPEESTELLRLTSGASDVTVSEVPSEAYATVKRAADDKDGKLRLYDLGVGYDADAFWLNLRPGAFASDRRGGMAPARRAAPRDLDGRRSPAVRGHGVPRRRPAGVRPDHARQQEVVFSGRAADAPRSRRRAGAAGVDRPHGSQRRRRARGRQPDAGPLHRRHAERPAKAGARRVRHPRRAEEGRNRRGHRHARRHRGDRADLVGQGTKRSTTART